jgi:FtsP/CotA-like multicopper oxidase with cupredoxin domain
MVTLPVGETIPIWGFAASCAGPAQLPGPTIDANVGDVVTVSVTNGLAGHTLSLEAPGIDLGAAPTDIAPGATASFTFTATAEGTYLYESSGDAGRQEAMGLYGALVVHSATPGQAYGNAFDAERVVLLSEIDPAFNAAPDTFDMRLWKPSYWLINGHPYPDTQPLDVPAAGQRRLLLRYLNAGMENTTMAMLGLRARLVGRDAYPLANPFSVVSETFPAGETADAIVTVPAAAAAGAQFPLYNRNLELKNGPLGGTSPAPGGMLTFIRVQ